MIENLALLDDVLNQKDQWSFDAAVYFFKDNDRLWAPFEKGYLSVREKEGRILSESEIVKLPYLPKNHRYASEWRLRTKPLERIIRHLKTNEVKGPILDLGCGNGWFTNYLSQATSAVVLGVEVNKVELYQAANFFKGEKLFFCYADIWETPFKSEVFQTITLNGVIQYFPSFQKIISRLLELLIPKGEIHIIDSPFYSLAEVNEAIERSKEYYSGIGEDDFAKNYSHHTWDSLNGLNAEVKYKKGLLRRLTKDSPFPWVVITKG
ncbi:MAG: SAM-dependent methyltransferase [Roseivirga sp.]|jgi:SAM-dependent methyltransferase